MKTSAVSWRHIVLEAWRGKTLARILTNHALRPFLEKMRGSVLDLAGGGDPGYLRFFQEGAILVRTNLKHGEHTQIVDFNAHLPFQDGSFDAVLLINALYIAERPEALAAEVFRVLKPGGSWIIASPFIANEMPEPHDYMRLTAEGILRMSNTAGFQTNIQRIGDRASAAAHLMHPFFIFNAIRACVFPLAYLLDRAVPSRVRAEHPGPLSYIVECVKSV